MPDAPAAASTPGIGHALTRHAAGSALFMVIGLLTVRTGLFGGRDLLVGDVHHHPYDSAWMFSGVHQALTTWPPSLSTDLIRTPEPLSLLSVFPDIGNGVLALPLVQLLGPMHAYDVWQAIQIALAGLATYALAFVLTRRHLPALTAGVLFAACPPLWFAIEWGEDDVAAMWVLPAYLAVLFHALDGPVTPRRAVAPALCLALVGWFNSYYLFFSATSTLVVLAATIPSRRSQDWLRPGGLFAALATAAYLPRLLLGIRASRKGLEEATSRVVFGLGDLVQRSPLYDETSSLDLARFLLFPDRSTGTALVVEGHLYMGLLALALAGVGLTVPRLRRLVLVGGVGFILALGAYLLWDGATPGLGPLEVIPLPGAVLTAVVPAMERMNHPFRWVNLTFVAVAVLAGAGIGRLSARAPLWVQVLAFAGLTWGVVVERAWAAREIACLDVATVDVGIWASHVPESTRRGILHLPVAPIVDGWPDLERNRHHLAAQLQGHGRPIHITEELPLFSRSLQGAELDAHLAELLAQDIGVVVLDEQTILVAVDLSMPMPASTGSHVPIARENLTRCGIEPSQLGPNVTGWVLPESCVD
ncbi:MAG: hypothetical protein GY913_24010 [Proteobacteria bacterium]|nr:hypothetical protein [Pseudomonadota bacterium]MCP4919979.1 hypothetical protein [Pseudomonadota bacterium]